MKNTILALSLTAILVSCKKDDPENTFTPTDVTGTTTVKGNISKNVITPDGSGGWTNSSTARIAAKDVHVSITVAKKSLYPNSSAQGADVYRATTDADGNYSMNVKTNAQGVEALVTIEGFTGTLDTIANGETRKGLSTSFQGTNFTKTLVIGQTAQIDYSFNSNQISTNPNGIQTGKATLTGSVSVSLIKQTMTGTVVSLSFINAPVHEGHKVYLRLNNDPVSLSPKVYETSTDINGQYTFDLTTVEMGTPGFPQTATVWINDFAATRDTIKPNNTRVLGQPGVFQMSSVSQAGLYNNAIKNAVYVRYNTFLPN